MENHGLAVITGAGTGIGRAIALEMAQNNVPALGMGRRLAPLESLRQEKKNIRIVSGDVATSAGRKSLQDAIPSGSKIQYLIHNAAIFGPIGPLMSIEPAAWRQHMAINLDAPLLLSQDLVPLMAKGGRILHISSGAAHGPMPGIGPYCTSKAGLYMLYRCLDQELKSRGIRVGSLRPGVVDTPIQDQARNAGDDLPCRSTFQAFKDSGSLLRPEIVAKYTYRLLATITDDAYAEKEWDIREHPIPE